MRWEMCTRLYKRNESDLDLWIVTLAFPSLKLLQRGPHRQKVDRFHHLLSSVSLVSPLRNSIFWRLRSAVGDSDWTRGHPILISKHHSRPSEDAQAAVEAP